MPKPIRDPLVEIRSVEGGESISIEMAGYTVKQKQFIVELRRLHPGRGMGIDPGVTTGAAVVVDEFARVWEFTFPPKKKGDRVMRVMRPHIIKDFAYDWALALRKHFGVAVEDSSHGAGYGQSILAENRMAFVLGLIEALQRPQIVPIQSVRAAVMGHARINPKDKWADLLPGDCADALALAVYAAEVMEDPSA